SRSCTTPPGTAHLLPPVFHSAVNNVTMIAQHHQRTSGLAGALDQCPQGPDGVQAPGHTHLVTLHQVVVHRVHNDTDDPSLHAVDLAANLGVQTDGSTTA